MIIKLHEGGSTYGISTIQAYINGCARRQRLKEEGENYHSLGTLTGTLIHALLEAYYKHGYFETQDVEWEGIDLTQTHFPAAETKAFTVFREYRLRYTEKELGKVIGNEIALETKNRKIVGCAPYTCRIDLVVKLLKRDVIRLKKTRRIDVDPGIWIVDHKTGGGIYPNTFEALANSLQFSAYMLTYAAVTKKRVQGCLVNFMTTTRDPKFHTLAIPFPGKLARARLFAITEEAMRHKWPKITLNRPNVARCYDFMSVCPYWVQGKCLGI